MGIQVRDYMMVGNRGETVETFARSLALLDRARPNRFVFSQLHLYPGTEEFEIFRRHGHVTPEIFFERDFFCLTCFAGDRDHERRIRAMLSPLAGARSCRKFDLKERRAAAKRFPDLSLAHADLCRALIEAGDPEAAETALEHALARGYFLPGVVHNLRACVAAARGRMETAGEHLDRALCHYPHPAVLENRRRLAAWRAGGQKPPCPRLTPGEGFESGSVPCAPEYPDPFGSF